MNTELSTEEENALRKHFQLKIRPLYKPSTIDKIVQAVNKCRTGQMKDTEFVNPITKIVDWSCYFELWSLYPKFVPWE